MHRAAFRNDHFGEVMGKNRFVTLMGALRFVAPDTMKEHSDWAGKPRPTDLMYKKTYKVDPVLVEPDPRLQGNPCLKRACFLSVYHHPPRGGSAPPICVGLYVLIN